MSRPQLSLGSIPRSATRKLKRALGRVEIVSAFMKRRLFRDNFRRMAERIKESGDNRFDFSWSNRMPIVTDATETLTYDAHYLYHTAWAARCLSASLPVIHHDFASDVRFATIVSAFVPVVYYEYRPLKVALKGFESRKADLTHLEMTDGSLQSLSCMHVVEHVGLGRYGDPIDPLGDLKAIRELKRVLAPGGDLYFVVPTGRASLRFNAHRIYSFEMIRSYFEDLALHEFCLLTDDGSFLKDPDAAAADAQEYGCGCYWFKKPEES